jgi:hypothetical protein
MPDGRVYLDGIEPEGAIAGRDEPCLSGNARLAAMP